jgi:hypothetical protein
VKIEDAQKGMKRITELKTLSYFENKEFGARHGVYQCKFEGVSKFFVITNNIAYVLSHYTDKSVLDVITENVKSELFGILGLKEHETSKETKEETK